MQMIAHARLNGDEAAKRHSSDAVLRAPALAGRSLVMRGALAIPLARSVPVWHNVTGEELHRDTTCEQHAC